LYIHCFIIIEFDTHVMCDGTMELYDSRDNESILWYIIFFSI